MWSDTNYVSVASKGTFSRPDLLYRANRTALKEKGFRLNAIPIGKPSAVKKHVSSRERYSILGKFGQVMTVMV
jgi:hypothetical protein